MSKTLLAVDPGPQNSSTEVTLLYIHISVILMVQASMPITICHSAMALCKHVFKNFNFTVSQLGCSTVYSEYSMRFLGIHFANKHTFARPFVGLHVHIFQQTTESAIMRKLVIPCLKLSPILHPNSLTFYHPESTVLCFVGIFTFA